MIKPIGPNEIEQIFPDEVIQAFNNLLSEKGNSNSITITQDKAIDEIISEFGKNSRLINRGHIFDKHWLDVEQTYRKAGWKVSFDKPGFNESYAASYTFSKK